MVKTSEGQVVLLSGEADVRKSLLTESLLAWNASPRTAHRTLRYFCSPQHTDSGPLFDHWPDGRAVPTRTN
jgi:hypothetical protein